MSKDAAKHWHESLMEVLEETGGEKNVVDGTIVIWRGEGSLEGIMCMHVDDFCFGSTNNFQKMVAGCKGYYREVEGRIGGKGSVYVHRNRYQR